MTSNQDHHDINKTGICIKNILIWPMKCKNGSQTTLLNHSVNTINRTVISYYLNQSALMSGFCAMCLQC